MTSADCKCEKSGNGQSQQRSACPCAFQYLANDGKEVRPNEKLAYEAEDMTLTEHARKPDYFLRDSSCASCAFFEKRCGFLAGTLCLFLKWG